MPGDPAAENLRKVDHIVVLMLENRSFDHMLGYLSLPSGEGGRGRTDIDGLQGPEVNFNKHGEETVPIEPFGNARLVKSQDPDHSGAGVETQMERNMGGFVDNYMATRKPGATAPKPRDPMRYQMAANVPIFDFLASEFAVCDRWFCSVPGSTWPNRLASLTGEAREKDNLDPPLYSRRSFVRSLPGEVSWRWYSSDPGSLRLIDGRYRVGWESNFAYVEKPSAFQPATLFGDIRADSLPDVAWIDPNFVDLGGLAGADDDHPPTDVMAAQSFVLKIYSTLRSAPKVWEKTMLVIVYDEHGGFYDHRHPGDGLPPEFTRRAEFGTFGPRVPAIVVSPYVERGAAYGSKQGNELSYLYDHTSLIKTILLRFADGKFDGLPPRVASAAHLGHLLTEPAPRPAPPVPEEAVDGAVDWWARQIRHHLTEPLAVVPALEELREGESEGLERIGERIWEAVDWIVDRLPFLHRRRAPVSIAEDANELEQGIAAAAVKIRKKGLPPGQP
ncbi:MAG: alkaline phosphatase family protein [Chloroflexota bacterium]